MEPNHPNSLALGHIDWHRDDFRHGFLQVTFSPASILGLLFAAGLLALLGPFNTYAWLALPSRFAYWLLLIGLNTVCAVALFWWFIGWRNRYQHWHELILPVAICSLCNAIPGAAIVTIINQFFLSHTSASVNWQFDQLVTLGLNVTLITAILFTVFISVRILLDRSSAFPDTMKPEAMQAFAKRIPEPIQGKLLALSSEDHYLRIYTNNGDALIHCSLKTAIAELPAQCGRQVHRSHWVAADAVQNAERRGNQWTLILNNHIQIPVSRQSAPELKKAGWFQHSTADRSRI